MEALATRCDPQFTPRMLEIINLIAYPYPRRKICEKLGISKTTLETYISRIMDRTGVHDYIELIAWAQRHGYGMKEAM